MSILEYAERDNIFIYYKIKEDTMNYKICAVIKIIFEM